MLLTKQTIHDEAKASVGVNAEIHRQLRLTQEGYKDKLRIIEELTRLGSLKGKFQTMNFRRIGEHNVECQFFTKDKAMLCVNLIKYNDDSYFFGTRGSPMRVLTGQNLVETQEIQRVERLAKRLSCSLFEARSIIGFVLLKEMVKENLGVDLFSKPEIHDIKERNVGVYSVGYANYVNLGPNRDKIFHLLGYLSQYTVSMDGDSFPLCYMFGNISASSVRREVEEGFIGKHSTLMFKKKKGKHLVFSQTWYNKKDEIIEKGHLGNLNAFEDLGEAEQSDLNDCLIRVDNVFYRPYLESWLKAMGVKDFNELTVRTIAPLFQDREFILAMCGAMSNELGLRVLLTAPTFAQLRALAVSDKLTAFEQQLMQEWLEKSRLNVLRSNSRQGVVLDWDDVIGNNKARIDAAMRIESKYYVDMRVSADFYKYLDEARRSFYMTTRDRLAQSFYTTGETDDMSGVDYVERRAEIYLEVKALLKELRNELTIDYANHTNKKRIVEEHLAYEDDGLI